MMSDEQAHKEHSTPLMEPQSHLSKSKEQQQLLLTNKFITHHPKAGINPLVDTAAYLFSIIGKLKQQLNYHHLTKLYQELLHEITIFEEASKSQGYSNEYIMVARYALCATIDETILNTSWGSNGQWDSYSLIAALHPDSVQQDRFFIILERITKDPSLYMDVMELMYICLSLGYQGQYRRSEFNHDSLEQITNALYKNIRAYRGDFNKTLSPFPIKIQTSSTNSINKKPRLGVIILATAAMVFGLFTGLSFLLDYISNKAYQELMHIGNSLFYEP